jgi:hypothetical protein
MQEGRILLVATGQTLPEPFFTITVYEDDISFFPRPILWYSLLLPFGSIWLHSGFILRAEGEVEQTCQQLSRWFPLVLNQYLHRRDYPMQQIYNSNFNFILYKAVNEHRWASLTQNLIS